MGRSKAFRNLLTVAVIPLLFSAPAAPQDEIQVTDQKILAEIREHNELRKNIEYLSDHIGPRLTGSDQLQNAVNWTSDLARRYGLENIHTEAWTVAHSWKRGSAEASITKPISRRLTIASAGWSPGTKGNVRGNIIYVSAKNAGELDVYRGKLSGAIVVLQQPADLAWQASPATDSSGSPVQIPEPPPDRTKPSPEDQFNAVRMTFFKEQ